MRSHFNPSIRYTTANNDFHGCLRDPGDGGLATAFSLLTINAIQPGACVTLDPATVYRYQSYKRHCTRIISLGGRGWIGSQTRINSIMRTPQKASRPAVFQPCLDSYRVSSIQYNRSQFSPTRSVSKTLWATFNGTFGCPFL